MGDGALNGADIDPFFLALGDAGQIEPDASEQKMRVEFRRCIVAKRDIAPGTVLVADDLALRRPAVGLHPKHLGDVIGKTTTKEIKTDEPFTFEHLQ